MKVLVTGGAGFIGSHIVDKLIEKGYEVVIIDNLSTGKEDNLNKKATFYKMDIIEKKLLEIFYKEKPEIVIHQAAQIDIQKSLEKPDFDANVNIIGTINVLEACRKAKIKKIIYASSAAVYGSPEYLPIDENHTTFPISYYGISKHTPEHYIRVYSQSYGMKYTILRYSNAYGIRQDPKGEGGVVSIFIDKFINNEPVIIFGDGNQTRDFIYVDDIARANILALENGDNSVINIGTGTQTSINKLYYIMKNIFLKNINPKYNESRPGDIYHSYFDISKANVLLNFKPKYSLEDGLKETIEYYATKKVLTKRKSN